MKIRPFSQIPMGAKQGWWPGPGDIILQHSRLGQLLHVAICRDDWYPMWDQPLHLEALGAITVPVNSRFEFGLIQVERPTVKSSRDYTFPDLDLRILGTTSWEFPRGFPKKGEQSSQTARREGEEELGSPITEVVKIGEVTPNTAFNSHLIPVYLVKVNENFSGTTPPDVNEKILKVQWISSEELHTRIARGEIYCGLTLAAFALYCARA